MTTVGTFSGSFPKVIKVSKRERGVGRGGGDCAGGRGGVNMNQRKKRAEYRN